MRAWLRTGAGVVVAVIALAGGLFAAGYATTPSAADVQQRIAAFATGHADPVLAPGQVPRLLAEAIVATEDERFYQHHGLDSIGIARAISHDLRYACLCEGGSTITQQLAKILYLDESDAGFNKVQGMALAAKIEARLNKSSILAGYLTVVPTGPTRYGMPAAACAYFGRPLDQLNLPSLALLAGLPRAPAAYDPLLHPARAESRRAQVLQAMVSEGYITAAEALSAAALPYRPPAHPGCGT